MAVHDLYREFSDGIAGILERGDVPWTPEPCGRPVRYNGRPYGGVNVLAQWEASRAHRYESPVWLSRGTVDELGGKVTAATPSAALWYAGMRPVMSPSPATGELEIRASAVWRRYDAFNVEAVEGLAARYVRADVADSDDAAAERPASMVVAASGGRSTLVEPRRAVMRAAVPDSREASGREFRKAGRPDTETRDTLQADDWHVASLAVEYRNHGPHDEFPGPWRVYGTGDWAHNAEGERLGVCRDLVRETARPARLNRRVDETRESLIVEIGAAFLAADLRLDAPGRPADADVEACCGATIWRSSAPPGTLRLPSSIFIGWRLATGSTWPCQASTRFWASGPGQSPGGRPSMVVYGWMKAPACVPSMKRASSWRAWRHGARAPAAPPRRTGRAGLSSRRPIASIPLCRAWPTPCGRRPSFMAPTRAPAPTATWRISGRRRGVACRPTDMQESVEPQVFRAPGVRM